MTFILWRFHLLIKATYSESFCCKFKNAAWLALLYRMSKVKTVTELSVTLFIFLRYLVPARESLIIYHEVSSLGRQVVYCNFCDYHNNAGIMHCIMWWIHRLDALFGGSSVKSVSSRLFFSFFLFSPVGASSYSSWQTDYELSCLPCTFSVIASATGFMSAADIICHLGGLQTTSQVSEQIYPKLCEKLGRGPWKYE